jgi:8-oxo-dGTP pyrophosphatase MutT (NUDIX family)
MHQLISHKLAGHQARRLKADSETPAAVLLAVTDDVCNPQVILTRRAQHLPTHQGQIAFPGGKAETEDQDLVATALREAHEEVGLLPEQVKVVGQLGQVLSRQGFVVTPVVGVVPA